MVQYIITPWRNRAELLTVRHAFYASNPSSSDRNTAVSRVSVWVQRGNCPHSVESTALLVSAMLIDSSSNSTYAVRAAYSAAFSRFVTGLLDGYQDKKHLMSMYSIAASIGLPATFVELRHQCTHEELPGLGRLRSAAERALSWIWEYYWKNIEVSSERGPGQRECRLVVQEYLRLPAEEVEGNAERKNELLERMNRCSPEEVMSILMEEMDSNLAEVGVLLESVRLWRKLIGGRETDTAEQSFGTDRNSMEDVRAEIEKAQEEMDQAEKEGSGNLSQTEEEDVQMVESKSEEGQSGWQLWKGPWVPKPIGIV